MSIITHKADTHIHKVDIKIFIYTHIYVLIQSMYINKYINTTSPNPTLNANTEFATCAGRMFKVLCLWAHCSGRLS